MRKNNMKYFIMFFIFYFVFSIIVFLGYIGLEMIFDVKYIKYIVLLEDAFLDTIYPSFLIFIFKFILSGKFKK